MASAKKKPPPPPKEEVEKQDAKSLAPLFIVLGLIVVGLGALIYWSLPPDIPKVTADDASADAESQSSGDASHAPLSVLDPQPKAISELAIVSGKPEDVIRKAATVEAIAKLLDVRHCGSTCEVLKKAMADKDQFEVDILKTEEVILPPEDMMDIVAPGLTSEERKEVHSREWAVVLRAQSNVTPDQMAARISFATAMALAEAIDGVIYDEACRRIQPVRDFKDRIITAKMGEPVFRPKQIVIQLMKDDDDSARLLTLGMARFGSADLIARGPDMADGPLLADVLNAAAYKIAAGQRELPMEIGIEDIARSQGKKTTDLMKDPSSSKPAKLVFSEAERTEGDPDNDIIELTPESTTSWPEIVSTLFNKVRTVAAPIDKDIAARAQKELPNALERMQRGDGELFVKGPFPIPPASRGDGGATQEYLWISVAACDGNVCKGTLSNTPLYASNLAPGKTTSVARKDVVDWVIRLHDGGLAGGESIKALEKK